MIKRSVFLPPHIKHPANSRTIMLDVMLCMLALYFIAAFYYGPRVWVLAAVSGVTCFLTEHLAVQLRLDSHNWRDLSSWVTGMMIPLMLPASIPYYVVITADLFAMIVIKNAFGGTGLNVFNPAAGGLAFVTACWPSMVFSYPVPFSHLEVVGPAATRLTNSIAYVLSVGGVPSTDYTSTILGIHPGPMGALNGLVLIACMLYLIARGSIRWWQPLITMGIVAVAASFFPRAHFSSATSIFYEIFGTSVLFGVVFLLSDPVSGCARDEAKLVSGVAAGVLIVLFNYFGAYQQSIVFVALIMNLLNHKIDRVIEDYMIAERRRRYERRQEETAG